MATMISEVSRIVFLRLLIVLFVILPCLGCDKMIDGVKQVGLNRSFHQKFSWRAENFFEDQQVIALCKAIESDDLTEMKRLIDAGADVNAKGKGNMTPLMWAFPDNKLERFTLLLENGADPNVKFTDNLGVPSAFMVGDSVTTYSSKTRFPGYFTAEMKHGGDGKAIDGMKMSLIHSIILALLPDAKERCKLALEAGADPNAMSAGLTPPMAAIVTASQYDLAMFLVENGSDPLLPMDGKLKRLVHFVLGHTEPLQKPPIESPQKGTLFILLKYLEEQGEDLDKARADIVRWREMDLIDGKYMSVYYLECEEAKKKKAAGQ